MKKDALKKFKKNKYNIYLALIGFFLILLMTFFVKNKIADYNLRKHDREIVIIKDSENNQHSYTLREIRKIKSIKKKVKLEKGLEEVELTGVALERLLGDLGYNLEESPNLIIEDSEGNYTTFPMSVALEVDRVLLVYKINNKPNQDYDDAMGALSLIDTISDNKESWVKDVKVLDIK
ncbi:hypothetical protein [Anaerococcus sp.]|uniref:hypothetical protein n=1 Tax=Anaerococcus sp. TaxID=1872515 RepID=UPI0027BA5848|nr:hypothetical protein [Anaerococcus sp.]MDU3136291.1 hypothetical protein [Anaerococcus prevotii]